MKLSILIPVFNEGKTIKEVLNNVLAVTIPDIKKEIIVVDDGSSDNTVDEIKSLPTKQKEITLIQHTKNQGKGAAVVTAIKHATGDYCIIQDADLEYDPTYIPVLLSHITKNTQVVYGTRLNRLPNLKDDERTILFFVHYFGNRFLSLITSILYGQWITDMETGYKLFPRKPVQDMQIHARSFDFEPEITAKLLKAGFHIKEVPIKTKPRGYDQGKKLHAIQDGSQALFTLFKYRFTN